MGNGYVQVDLGSTYDISAIGFAPRSEYEYRCADSMFQISQDGKSWDTVYTIANKPSGGMQYITSVNGTSARYIRYIVPEGAPDNQWNKDSVYCCNIAEIELYGKPNAAAVMTEIKPVKTSGSNPWNNSANDHSKVFDGDADTYFDGVGNGYVQADLGGLYNITAIGYTPRKGYEYRCPDSMFQISQDGKNWTTIHTISKQPAFAMQYIKEFSGSTTARYVRYIVPDGAPQNIWNDDDVYCCNIAEIKIYGESAGAAAVIGDVNKDGSFTIADAVMLQQWLLNVPDATLTDWKSADLCDDGIIDVFDFCEMRELLVAQ